MYMRAHVVLWTMCALGSAWESCSQKSLSRGLCVSAWRGSGTCSARRPDGTRGHVFRATMKITLFLLDSLQAR